MNQAQSQSIAALRAGSFSFSTAQRRPSRHSQASSNAAIALPAVIAEALAGSALDDDNEVEDDTDVDVKKRYGRKASRGAEKSEVESLRKNSGAVRRLSNLSNSERIRAISARSMERLPTPLLAGQQEEEDGNDDKIAVPPNALSTVPSLDISIKSTRTRATTLESGQRDGTPSYLPSGVPQFEPEEDIRDTGTLNSTRGLLIISVTCVAQLLDNVSMTSVNIALPAIGESLNISKADLSWLISGYTLTFGGFLLLAGVMADRYGKKKVFIIGMSWLSLWTLIDGFATSEIQLIIFRALQGLGAAATVPAGIGILSSYCETISSIMWSDIFGMFGAIGFVVGLVFGGIFTQALGWRYVFRITAPIGVAVAVAAYFALPEDKVAEGPKPALDFLGAGLGTGAMILMCFVLNSGGVMGWNKGYIIALIIVSVAMLFGFAIAEKKVKNPIMPLSLWKLPAFAAIWIVGFLMYGWWQSVVLYIVLIAQEVHHLNAMQTAVRFIPMGFVGGATSIVTGRIVHKYSIRTLFAFGMLVCTVTLIPACVMSTHTSFWISVFPSAILGVIGVSIAYNTASISMMSSVPPKAKSLAGGLANTSFQLGSGVGVAVASAVAQAVLRKAKDPESIPSVLKSYQAAMWTCGGLAGAGMILSLAGVKAGKVYVSGPVAH